ncbi:MAG: AAA family ATPase, partial [Dehalococcoidia bacterium]
MASSPVPIFEVPPFVGREAELSVLIAALDAAAAGRGGLVLVAGEPGIGKTRLAEELAAVAGRRNVRILWGRCYEGEGAPAFWPWVEVLRAALRGRDAASSRAALGSGAGSIAPLLPEVLELMPDLPAPPLLEPAEARFRLFQAVTTLLANVGGAGSGLLLILDDLHWADTPSLLLLEFLARDLTHVPVLVVGTYRDVEVRRGDPLARTLGEIARRPQVARLTLAGFSLAEVARIVALTRGAIGPSSEMVASAPPQDELLAARVHRDTDGNPLFVQELVRLLAAEGRLGSDGTGSDGTGSATSGPVPETVRDVIGRRLDRLSPACRQVLATAAVIGREFGEDVLAAAADAAGEALLEALEEAETAHVIQAVPGAPDRYRFAHALIRETLYEDISTARRARLHLRVAEATEQIGAGDEPAQLAVLAGHYRLAGAVAPAGKAIDYAQRAGAAAAAVFAWEEAAAHWQAALEQLQRRGGANDPAGLALRCDLLLALGEALLSAGAPRRVAEEVASQAFGLAEALEDGRRAWQSCRLALSALVYFGDTLSMTTSEFRRWAERADRFAAPDTSERVSADISLGYLRSVMGRPAEGRNLKRRALALARTLNDPQARLVAALHIIDWPDAPTYHAERLRLAQECATWPREAVNPTHLGDFLFHAGCLLLDWGERAQAEALWREVEELATRTHDAILLLHRHRRDIHLALLDGRLHDAMTAGARLIALA